MAAYLELRARGELSDRVKKAKALLGKCIVCPRRCGVNRLEGKAGVCRSGPRAAVSSYGPHFGEESPLVGRRGSGTIFFAGCNLRCVYCQNYEISQLDQGYEVASQELAGMMLALQRRGCHNINLVSPSHVVPHILEALEIAEEQGLHLPLVYNSGGYDSLETLKLLDGIVDIYMPDMKYSDEVPGQRYSGVKEYPQVNRTAVKEMHCQVGDLRLDRDGVAVRGLLVRHLVLPNSIAGTAEVVRFLAQEVSHNTYLNVMAQYRPCYRAAEFRELSRPLERDEFSAAVKLARHAGLTRLDGLDSPFALRFI